MARGDGQLLQGFGNLIGAVTQTIEKKNDQEFSLRREDRLTQLQNEKDLLLTQFQAINSERQSLQNYMLQRSSQLSDVGVKIKRDNLKDTNAAATLGAITTGYLSDNVANLNKVTDDIRGNIDYLDGAMNDYNVGIKSFAISNKEWIESAQSGGALTLTEAKDLFRMQMDNADPDAPENEYLFQGFFAAATNKEAILAAEKFEADKASQLLRDQATQAEIDLMPLRANELRANIARANWQSMESAQKYQANEVILQKQRVADTIDEAMQIPVFKFIADAMADTSVSIQDRIINAESIWDTYYGEDGSHSGDIANLMDNTLRMQLLAEVQADGSVERLLNDLKATNPAAYNAMVGSLYTRRMTKEGFEVAELKEDLGGTIMDLAMMAKEYKQSGYKVIQTDIERLKQGYVAWASRTGPGLEKQLKAAGIQAGMNPASLLNQVENFGLMMSPAMTKAGGYSRVFEQLNRDALNVIATVPGLVARFGSKDFAERASQYDGISNIPIKTGQGWNVSALLPQLMLTSSSMGDYDSAAPISSTSLSNMQRIVNAGEGLKEVRSLTPEIMMEENQTGGSLLYDEIQNRAKVVGEGGASYHRADFTRNMEGYVKMLNGLRQTSYRYYNSQYTHVDSSGNMIFSPQIQSLLNRQKNRGQFGQ